MPRPLKMGTGELCPKCHTPMERRRHSEKPKDKTYWFIEWDVCLSCHHVQHYEKFKTSIWNEDLEKKKNRLVLNYRYTKFTIK